MLTADMELWRQYLPQYFWLLVIRVTQGVIFWAGMFLFLYFITKFYISASKLKSKLFPSKKFGVALLAIWVWHALISISIPIGYYFTHETGWMLTYFWNIGISIILVILADAYFLSQVLKIVKEMQDEKEAARITQKFKIVFGGIIGIGTGSFISIFLIHFNVIPYIVAPLNYSTSVFVHLLVVYMFVQKDVQVILQLCFK